MSLLALTDYLAASGELAGSYEWQVGLNGQPRESGVVSNPTNRLATPLIVAPMTQLRDGDNRLDLIRSTGPGRLYYTVQLTLFSGAEDMPFVNRGFTVAREYLPLGGSASAQPVHQLRVGELVQVKVTVMAPSELHDVLIEDPLPAGLEALDTKLKTTSVAVAAKVQDARTPGWQPWTHVDVRSDKVALFATYLTRGAHQYTYVARAVLPGDYHVLPTSGREQYFPEVFARGDGRRFTVLP
jgi:uncharacterized protein YfaS (alpha-2-macroglobulin family)